MPQDAIDYVQSLPEFNAEMFKRITGIDVATHKVDTATEEAIEPQEIQDLMPERKGKDGNMTMEFADGRKADLKLHSDIAVGFNQALTQVEAVLPQIIALAEKRGAEGVKLDK